MKKNKIKNIDSKSFHFDHLKHLVTAFLKENPDKSFTGSQILKAIHSKNKIEDIAPVFKRLIQTKKLQTIKMAGSNTYRRPQDHHLKHSSLRESIVKVM